MINSPYFVQHCPVCGRPLEIRVRYLGGRVACQHCRGWFMASDPALGHAPATEQQQGLLQRAERLIEMQVRRRGRVLAAPELPGAR